MQNLEYSEIGKEAVATSFHLRNNQFCQSKTKIRHSIDTVNWKSEFNETQTNFMINEIQLNSSETTVDQT